jgi:hypothetical protein
MIWQDEHSSTSRQTLAGQLLSDIPVLCGNPALAEHAPLAEAAQGVALYLDQIEIIPENMDLRQSRELLAHALDAAGEAALARRIRLFGNRIIYPAKWIACGNETVWVLDLQQLISPKDTGMEIILFQRIRVVLATFSDVWDTSAGRGFLGLKGLAATATILLGQMGPNRTIKELTLEMRGFCKHYLQESEKQRGWQNVPAILTLLS